MTQQDANEDFIALVKHMYTSPEVRLYKILVLLKEREALRRIGRDAAGKSTDGVRWNLRLLEESLKLLKEIKGASEVYDE